MAFNFTEQKIIDLYEQGMDLIDICENRNLPESFVRETIAKWHRYNDPGIPNEPDPNSLEPWDEVLERQELEELDTEWNDHYDDFSEF